MVVFILLRIIRVVVRALRMVHAPVTGSFLTRPMDLSSRNVYMRLSHVHTVEHVKTVWQASVMPSRIRQHLRSVKIQRRSNAMVRSTVIRELCVFSMIGESNLIGSFSLFLLVVGLSGRQNYNSYELFGVSHRCHTANLVRDACEIDVFCSGLASCQGATLQLPNLNLSTVQYDFDHTITDVRDIGLLRHMRKRFITSNRTLQIHASDIRVACGVITYLLEIRMGDSCHQGQPIWQLNTTDSGIHPVTLPGGPVPSNTTLHLLLGGRDQNGGIVYSPCIYSVRVDVTPPNPGRVRCGQSIEEDCRAFPSRDFIHISFDGESDPESDIQYGEFDVFDSKLNSLLLRPIRLTLWNIATRTVTIKFDHKASLGEHIIVIKRIYNQANLTSINQTLPIIMDDTPPVFEGCQFIT